MVVKQKMVFNSHFEDYLNYLRQKGYTEKTIGEHKRFLGGSLAHCDITEKKIKDIKLTDVGDVMEAGKQHGEFGPQRSVVTFRRYLKFLQESGIKLPFDWRDIETPRVPFKQQTFLSETELKRLLDSIPIRKFEDLRTKTLLEVLFSTGMRIGEALNLKWDDISWHKKEALIKTKKTGDEEYIYFSDRSLYWLKEWRKKLQKKKKENEFVFVSNEGNPLSQNAAKQYLRLHQEEWDTKKHITFHTLRRTFGNLLMEKRPDLKAIQTLLRHKSPRTTLQWYVHCDSKRAKDFHRKYLPGI